MVKLQMGIWAGIAAGGVMVLLCLVPILGCLFSSSKKAKKAALEESAAEKGEVVYSEPVAAFASTPTRPANAALQKPNVHIGQHDIGMRSQSSTPSMSPSHYTETRHRTHLTRNRCGNRRLDKAGSREIETKTAFRKSEEWAVRYEYGRIML
jgi:hypothetical protein